MVNVKQVLRWIPEQLKRNLDTQPWNLALMICFLTGQIFLRSLEHRDLRIAPLMSLCLIYIALRRPAYFHTRGLYTKALLVLIICLTFALRWQVDLYRQARFYQKYVVLNQGVRPINVRGVVDEDFTYRINRPKQNDAEAWITVPFRIETGERIELGMSQDDWNRLEGSKILDVSGHPNVLRQAANPGGFNAHIIGAGRGIYIRLNVTSINALHSTGTIHWQERSRLLRTALFNMLGEAQGEEFAGLYLALWSGDRRYVSDRLSEAMDTLGLAYRLSPNGQHLSLWYMTFPSLLRMYTRKNRQTMRVLLLFILTLLTGGSIPLIKGILFQTLNAYQSRRKMNRSRIQTLGLVALILLAYRPSLIIHPGFVISMSVSYLLESPVWMRQQMEDFGIHVEVRRGRRGLKFTAFKQKAFRLMMLVILLPTLLNLAGMTANRLTMITMFFVPWLHLIGIPIVLISNVEPGAGQWLVEQLVLVASALSQANFKLVPFDVFRLFLLGLMVTYGALLNYCTLWRMRLEKRTLRTIATSVSLMILLMIRLNAWPLSQEIQVTFFSVGSADMILCETRSSAYVIDTGEHEGHARILLDALHQRRRSGLEAVVLSHEDKDHSGGIDALLKYSPVNMVLSPSERDLPLSRFETLRREVKENVAWHDGSLRFSLYPAKEDRHIAENDRSLVLLVEGKQNLLFTGDIESKREVDLTHHLTEVDLLKVPHHGSRTSSTEAFIDHIKPKIAIISVGPKHGHPHDEVLDRYEERRIPVYRTDKQGAITYTVRSGKGQLKTTYGAKNQLGLLSSLIDG